jgi:hypothetical protein
MPEVEVADLMPDVSLFRLNSEITTRLIGARQRDSLFSKENCTLSNPTSCWMKPRWARPFHASTEYEAFSSYLISSSVRRVAYSITRTPTGCHTLPTLFARPYARPSGFSASSRRVKRRIPTLAYNMSKQKQGTLGCVHAPVQEIVPPSDTSTTENSWTASRVAPRA